MRIKLIGGEGVPQLEKSEVSRILDAIYITRRMAKEIKKGKPELEAAITVVETAVRKFGEKHLNADGTLKVTERAKREEPEAPVGHA